MSEHRTEVDGWQAIWRIDRCCIRMMLVRNLSESETLISMSSVDVAPDLVQVRERFPELSRLWDAVRHEYWVESLGPGSNGARSD
ncbi:hypothetical protein ACIBG0_16970 [Nocardia sp. NPDC050630]|uniref:hypothetical protein n=1 Tax=Nocardia sp. NPDC050630 TaxID=3364321 RepID=UPI0037A786E1